MACSNTTGNFIELRLKLMNYLIDCKDAIGELEYNRLFNMLGYAIIRDDFDFIAKISENRGFTDYYNNIKWRYWK